VFVGRGLLERTLPFCITKKRNSLRFGFASALNFNHLLIKKKIKYRKPKFLVEALLAPINLSQGCGDCPLLDGKYRMILTCN